MADDQIDRLCEGNEHFREAVLCNEANRVALETGQAPFAAILTCADSRVAPEIVFNRGRGEVFVVRVAGNVANSSSIASLEYAVAHLGVRLIVVMGHEACGAVGASIAGNDESPHLEHLVAQIQPAVASADDHEVDTVGRRNAVLNAERLKNDSEILKSFCERSDDPLRIVPAFYNWSGRVDFDLA